MRFTINLPFDYEIEFSTHARHKWTHFKIHKYPIYTHLVWGKISLIWGQPMLEEYLVCNFCYSDVQRIGEDYIDCCEECGIVEGNTSMLALKELEARQK